MKFIFILIIVNLSYAVSLKLFMLLPAGVPSFVRLLFFLIMQMIYTGIYIWITLVLIFNWRDVGNEAFTNMINLKSLSVKTISEHKQLDSPISDEKSSWNIYKHLKDTDNYRKDHRKRKL